MAPASPSADMNQIALITKDPQPDRRRRHLGAEAALAELADTEGDGALMVVLEQLQPKDILAVIREYDPPRSRSSTCWSRPRSSRAPWSSRSSTRT
jgi:hypothetical protein